jgi:iron complex outermembrane receptor protein
MRVLFKFGSVAPAMAAMFCSFLSGQASAQQNLPEVRVDGRRDRDGPSITQPDIVTARERIAQTPGGVDIVDMETAREGRVSTYADSLGYSAGVFAAPRFGAEETRLSIRGSGLQRTFHLRGIKLMQDAIPLNLADGSGDFQSLEPLAARYAEVFRGANALQYGASNLGGAINYVSPTGHDAAPLEGRLEAGSFGYRRLFGAAGGVQGDADYYATVSDFGQDGFRDHARQNVQRATANLGYRLAPNLETRFYLGAYKSVSSLPGNLTPAQMDANPRQANPGNITSDQKRDVDFYRLSNKTVVRFGESRIEIAAYLVNKTLFHPIFQVLDQKNLDAGVEARFVSEARLFGRRNLFTAGYAPARDKTYDVRWANVSGTRGAKTNDLEQLAVAHELYLENQHYVMPKVALVAGVQRTSARRQNVDKFIAPGPTNTSFDVRYSGVSPKLGARYEWSPQVQFFTNLSNSYEPPSFGELAGGLRPSIVRAQRGTTFELGSRGTLGASRAEGSVHWDAVYYRARLRDELLTTSVIAAGNAGPAPVTVNADRTVHEGIELGTGGSFLKSFEWRQALFVNRFRFDKDPVFGNNVLPGLPKALLKAEVLYRTRNAIYGGVSVESSIGSYPVDMANTLFADGYTIWGAKIGQKLDQNWSWFVDARNLANRKYVATTGVIRAATFAGGVATDAQFLPGDGRSIYAGVQWRI